MRTECCQCAAYNGRLVINDRKNDSVGNLVVFSVFMGFIWSSDSISLELHLRPPRGVRSDVLTKSQQLSIIKVTTDIRVLIL